MAKEIAKASQNELTWKHKIGYAAGDAGGVMTLVLVSSYMTRYITNVLTIPYATLSVLLLIWNIWDMVNDPLMGTLMDKTFAKAKSDRDKFRPWILYSIAPIVLGIIAFFSVPSLLNGFAAVAALFIFKIIYELGYTMMNIGMGSLLGTMATNDPERATLSSARGMGSTVGSLVGMVAVPQILSRLGENPQGYFWAAVVCGILGGFSVLVHYLWTEERNIAGKNSDPNDEKNNVKFTDIINVFKENRAFLALSLHSIIIVFGTTIYNQFNAYMYADVLGDISLLSYTSIISMVLTIVILTFAPGLVKRFGGTVRVIRAALLIGIALMGSLFALMLGADVPAVLFLVASGVGFAMINLSVQMQWGLVGESIDYNEYLTGKRTEGAIYGTFSLTRRVGQTISQSLAVLMIGWIGYNPELTNAGIAQADGTIFSIKFMTLVVPAIAALGSWACFKFIWHLEGDLRDKLTLWKDSKTADVEGFDEE